MQPKLTLILHCVVNAWCVYRCTLDSILSTKWRPDLGVTGNISQSIIGEYIRAIREEFHDLWQVAKTYSKQNIWRILHLVKTAVVSRVNSSPSCHQSFLNSPLPTRLYSLNPVTICYSSRAPRTTVRALKQPKIAPLTYNSPKIGFIWSTLCRGGTKFISLPTPFQKSISPYPSDCQSQIWDS